MAQPTEYENLSYNAPDGSQWGRSATEKLSFYGATPVVRLSVSTNDVSTTNTTTATTAVFGFVTAVELTNLITAVSTMQAQMKLMGLLP